MNATLRYAARGLLRSPGFATVAVLSLAIGIGANTAIFSLVNALLFRPLAAARPHELVAIYTSDFSGPLYGSSSEPDVADFAAGTRDAFEGIAAYAPFSAALRTGEGSEVVWGEMVTGNYFDVMGVPAVRGRVFRADQERTPAAVISHRFWQRRFGSDPAAVGRTLVLNGNPFTVIGVMPEEFTSAWRVIDVDLWAPMMLEAQLSPGNRSRGQRSSRGLMVIARLRPGVTAAQAQSRLAVVASQLHGSYPESWTDRFKRVRKVTVVPEREARVPPETRMPVIGFMGLLMFVVGAVLLVACSNLANLLLARALTRRREIAIRLALGAGRRRVIRQLLGENALVAAIGGVAGVLVSVWITRLLLLFKPPIPVPIRLDLTADWRVLAFAFAATLFTGVAMGILPALAATRCDLTTALKESGSVTPGGWRRFGLRNVLVAAETAVSLVLLIGAGLFLRSLRSAYSVELGFNPDRLALICFDLRLQGYDQQRGRILASQLVERAASLAGAESAVIAQKPLLGPEAQQRRYFQMDGYTPQPGEDMEVHFNSVGAGYFRTLGIRMARGREFTSEDREGSTPVVVVSEAFARRYWPGQDPLGKRISTGRVTRQVVGIAADARYIFLGDPALPMVFLPWAQSYTSDLTLHVRTAMDPAAVLPALRAELANLDRNLPLSKSATMFEHLGAALLPARVAGTLLAAFGLIALLLAAIGLYGVMAYSVTQRTREIGLRMAMGARRADVLRMVFTSGLGVTCAGVAAGLALCYGLTRFLTTLLYGISPTDPLTFAGVAAALIAVAMAAGLIPALRASRIDPIAALRYE